MRQLIYPVLASVLLLVGCATTREPTTAAQHDDAARHYEATADSIEDECWKDLRHELTVSATGESSCWKAEDIRFLESNRHAAAEHRAEAAKLRTQTAQSQTARR
jgi:hypothetical protein